MPRVDWDAITRDSMYRHYGKGTKRKPKRCRFCGIRCASVDGKCVYCGAPKREV